MTGDHAVLIGDAADLARALHGADSYGELPWMLKQWEAHRLSHLTAVARHGIRLAAHSSLGSAGPQFLSESRKAGLR